MSRSNSPSATVAAALSGAAQAPKMHALIKAAEDIFIAKGYHTATMNDVARAAGMSKKTVYQLIDSKADLLLNLLAHYQSLLTFPNFPPDTNPRIILIDNLIRIGEFLLSKDQIAIIRLISAEYGHSPDLGRVFHKNRFKKAKISIESCLRDIGLRNKFDMQNVSELSDMLLGMAIGEFHITALIGLRAAPTKAALEKRIRQSVDIFLRGCGCRIET